MAIREKVILQAEEEVSKKFDKAGGSVDDLRDKLKKLAVGAGITLAIKKFAQLGVNVTKMAIDADEAKAAFDTTFGAALPRATAFVEDFANKAGFATFELQQLMAITGNVVQGIGATEAESAALSESMAILAGDVASFSNASGGAEAVLLALQSAINGEREALKTYGLAINEAEVTQRALNTTNKDAVGELTRLEKAQATVAIAYEKAGKAIGDLDRTQESAANTLRRIGARMKEAGVEAGQTLLPALEDLLPVIEDIIPAATDAAVAVAGFIASFSGVGAAGLGKIPDILSGIAITVDQIIASLTLGRVIIEEIFSLGFADTTALREGQLAAEHAGDISAGVVRARKQMEAGGTSAVITYADSLVELANNSDLSNEGLRRLAAATGVSTEEQFRALTTLREFADEKNWRPDNIRIVEMALAGLTSQLIVNRQNAEDAAPAYVDYAVRQNQAAAAVLELNSNTAQQADRAKETTKEILKLADATAKAAAKFRGDLAKSAGEFIQGFEKMPKRLRITVRKFGKILSDNIEETAAFWANLTVLAEAGLGHLAESIRAKGPEAAGLLENLVDDMGEATRIDTLLEDAGGQMDELTGAYADALERNDAPLTAMGQYGESLIDELIAGVKRGDLTGALLEEVSNAVAAVTGNLPSRLPPTGEPGSPFHRGTWSVPGGPRDEVAATLRGTEIVVPPEGTGGRAEFARQIGAEIRSNGGTSGDMSGGVSITIEQILVTVPAGSTITEAVSAAAAEAHIEALLS